MNAVLFQKVVEFLYTGRIENIDPDICIELLVTSNMLGLKRLTQLCERTILPLLSEENVLAIYEAAIHYNAPQLIEAAKYAMVKLYPMIVDSEDYLKLDSELKKELETRRNEYLVKKEQKLKKERYLRKLNCHFYDK